MPGLESLTLPLQPKMFLFTDFASAETTDYLVHSSFCVLSTSLFLIVSSIAVVFPKDVST